MKVTVSVFGRFHAFNLAYHLYKYGHLRRLITSYPTFEVVKYGIPAEKVCSLLSHQIIPRIWQKLPIALTAAINPQNWIAERFDKAAEQKIPDDTDLYVGWSSFSERGLLRAKHLGAITLLERGSAHIEYQNDILREEYEQYGLKPNLPHPAIIEKEKREYEIADRIVIPSIFVERTFLEKGFSPKKLIRVPYGVDLQQFQELPKTDQVFRVVFAGTMSLQKGVHYLLQAFAELNLPDAELWLLGAKLPEIEPFFEKYQRMVRFIGHVPQSTLAQYYSQCSVFVICSIQEGLALVQPQAMACGLPLICTTNTGGEDLIENGKEGFVIPIRDVSAIKEKILYLYENREICHAMGQAAKERVQSYGTWDDYGQRMVDRYRSLLQP